MAPNNPDLKSLRREVSDRQRAILDDVWAHIKEKNIGLPERPLLEKYGKATLTDETGKLGGTVIRSDYEENKLRYNLTVIGIFLTSDGPRLEKLVERYLMVLRDAYRNNRDIERFSSKELASWAPDVSPSELNELRQILYRAHGSLASSLAGWNAEEWFAAVDDDVVELKNVHDWPSYIEPRIMKGYDPREPAGERERMKYQSPKFKPDPIWDAISQTDILMGLNSDLPRTRTTSPRSARAPSPRNRPPDRARRLNLSFMKDDAPLQLILDCDWKEACQHFRTGSWKSCVLLCGGMVEGLLLWQLEQAQRRDSADPEGVQVDIRYDGETLSSVLRLSREQGLIGEDESSLMDWARLFRNVIHPGNQRREGRTPAKSHADLALKLVQVVAEGVRSKIPKGVR